jgi:hypothetical protein
LRFAQIAIAHRAAPMPAIDILQFFGAQEAAHLIDPYFGNNRFIRHRRHPPSVGLRSLPQFSENSRPFYFIHVARVESIRVMKIS